MKKILLAAFTVLSLGIIAFAPIVAIAQMLHNGSTIAGTASATRIQQTGSY